MYGDCPHGSLINARRLERAGVVQKRHDADRENQFPIIPRGSSQRFRMELRDLPISCLRNAGLGRDVDETNMRAPAAF
jgi:hypothetical protein